MAYLTTHKLVNSFAAFHGALKKGPIHIFDEVFNDPLMKQRYEATVDDKAYAQEKLDHIDKGLYETGGTLVPASDFNCKTTQEYYLLGPFKIAADQTDGKFHLRFENPGHGEITSFHLTNEKGSTAINYQIPHSTTKYKMKGHLFFSVNGGVISYQKIGGKIGSSNKQMSDARLMTYTPDVVAMMYYFMYRIQG